MNGVARINRYAVPVGVLYAKKMMSKKHFIRDLSCRDSPTDQLQTVFFQFIQAFPFDREVKLLRKSLVELSCQTLRHAFRSQLINFQQEKMSAST